MLHSEATSLLLFVIIILCLLAIFILIYFKKQKEKTAIYKVNNSIYNQKYKMNSASNKNLLDPHEVKLLKAILESPNNIGLDVGEINELLNLKKLSKENQRQRRHIILKELNLKLYLISGVRETITRVPSENDKRVKYYSFVSDVPDFDIIKNLALSYS